MVTILFIDIGVEGVFAALKSSDLLVLSLALTDVFVVSQTLT